MAQQEREGWRPIAGRERWTVRVLAALVLVDLIAVGSGWMELSLLERAAGPGIGIDEANANDSRQRIIGILQLLLLIAAAVFFIRWLRRITANLPALTPGPLKYGTGWATGGWFVPILNLWRPYQVVRQAWDRSADDDAPMPRFFALWWAAWLVMGFLGQAAFRTGLRAEELDAVITSSRITFASDIASALAGVLAILVVRELSERHRRAARERGLAP